MSHPLTETPTYPASVNVPDDGDPRNAASVETPFQNLTDRTAFLHDALLAHLVKSHRPLPLSAASSTGHGSPPTPDWVMSNGVWMQVAVGTSSALLLDIDQIDVGSTIATITLGLTGTTHAALPGTQPKL